MEIALVNEVEVEKLTPEGRAEIADMLRRVLGGDGFKLTRMQERAGANGEFHLLLAFEPDPNPHDIVTARPL